MLLSFPTYYLHISFLDTTNQQLACSFKWGISWILLCSMSHAVMETLEKWKSKNFETLGYRSHGNVGNSFYPSPVTITRQHFLIPQWASTVSEQSLQLLQILLLWVLSPVVLFPHFVPIFFFIWAVIALSIQSEEVMRQN